MKDLNEDFLEEAQKEENQPFMLIEIFLGREYGVWRITSLDEPIEIEVSDPKFLKEPS